jgi:peptide/nickel transport system substrate-binding protein
VCATAFAVCASVATPGAAQRSAAPGTVVIVEPQYAAMPIPTLMYDAAAHTANFAVADQLFLRLATLGNDMTTAGDRGFRPGLARSWTRRDSVTIVFELDPRARWHDGVPVTSRDVVHTFQLARDPQRSPRLARPLRWITDVRAEGSHRVVFRFSRAYGEQVYDAVHHVQPLPAHLVAGHDRDALRQSEFARQPVGNGPFRWSRAEPGQFVELTRVTDFFLGAPGIERLVIRVATSPDARLNLMLSGEGDAMENLIPPLANLERLRRSDQLRLVTSPSATVGYLLFNQRARGDTSRPHPILSDPIVRRALVLALDRESMVRAAYGPYARVATGPVSQILWIGARLPRAARQNVPAARRMLADAGWRDSDGDGILDRGGRPLTLGLQFPTTSTVRRQMALQAQEQLRGIGVNIEVDGFEGPVWFERRNAGEFDIDFSSATQDPSPSGLLQSWSCAGIGGTNVAHYCNPAVDSLMNLAIATQADPMPLWRDAIRLIERDAPAAFMYAPVNVVAVDRRIRDVHIRPDSPWAAVREWTLRPGGSGSRAGR